MLSFTEENYLKAIYHLSEDGSKSVLTNAIAEVTKTRAASVTDMIKKLSAKDFISYEKYYGVKITKQGRVEALQVIRKHRLWETFLVQKLQFNWDEVHEIAEQLEHIQSSLLIRKLDEFLGYPSTDPHGEPIPDKHGKVSKQAQIELDSLAPGYKGVIIAVKDSDSNLLKYLNRIGAKPGKRIKIITKEEYDESLEIEIGKKRMSISKSVSQNIYVTV
ncbi:MAG: metal-dependent transcriptional regulator [Cyclobacteriaceae bacterium]|nr:metal-dependent transcriptional regulator [Cyclobacteriaceae bacterium]MDH4297438.1 metal-dependent transcriptional regulator [Cyclobacteriaceae bacterium]MDH5250212.1 metal-dependent transcriptional regulator [Cyclobacteriaceae bacterium]